VTPPQGKLLHLLARACGARRILEIGTLGAYSTIWLARALPPSGKLITLEIDLHHAEVARRNLERAKVSGRVEIRVGDAAVLLDAMQGFVEPFDFVFVDADKKSSDVYFKAVLTLSHPGTVIIVDNVVREGKVADASSDDEDIRGIRRMTEWLATQKNISATAIQTVGGKSYDGFLMAIVKVRRYAAKLTARYSPTRHRHDVVELTDPLHGVFSTTIQRLLARRRDPARTACTIGCGWRGALRAAEQRRRSGAVAELDREWVLRRCERSSSVTRETPVRSRRARAGRRCRVDRREQVRGAVRPAVRCRDDVAQRRARSPRYARRRAGSRLPCRRAGERRCAAVGVDRRQRYAPPGDAACWLSARAAARRQLRRREREDVVHHRAAVVLRQARDAAA
jgi:predicted O-methyltransferase YrrM